MDTNASLISSIRIKVMSPDHFPSTHNVVIMLYSTNLTYNIKNS